MHFGHRLSRLAPRQHLWSHHEAASYKTEEGYNRSRQQAIMVMQMRHCII